MLFTFNLCALISFQLSVIVSTISTRFVVIYGRTSLFYTSVEQKRDTELGEIFELTKNTLVMQVQ